MGLKFKDIVTPKEITIKDLKDKIVAIDTYNLLYQFLTTIRGPDGSPFTDSKGRVTSHLIGLFNRTTSFMEEGLKLVFVFDGTPPAIKKATWEKRSKVKHEASLLLDQATDDQDFAAMKKYSSRTVKLTSDMVADAKKVISALGLPIVQAPSEGEAQTAFMVKHGDAYASISQDYDNLIFGCPTLVRNLSIAGKRKKTGTLGFQVIKPEMIILKDVLTELKLTQDQLIVLAILVGTDYNPGGINGIGPKKGLKLVHKNKEDFIKIFEEVKWSEHYPDLSWEEIFETIKEIPTTTDYVLEWKKVDVENLKELLLGFDFSEQRISSKLGNLKNDKLAQKGLSSFF